MRAIPLTEKNRTRIINECGAGALERPMFDPNNPDRKYYIVVSRNENRLEHPYFIWSEKQFRRYYAFTEKENPNKFVPVRRIK